MVILLRRGSSMLINATIGRGWTAVLHAVALVRKRTCVLHKPSPLDALPPNETCNGIDGMVIALCEIEYSSAMIAIVGNNIRETQASGSSAERDTDIGTL